MTLASQRRRDSLAHMGVVVHSPCAPRIAVAIADDHPVMREGLARLIADECDLAFSGSAATADELCALVTQQPPRVLVMDLVLGEADGLTLIKELAVLAPHLRIVVFTTQPANVYAERCLRAGAHAYVMKQESVATLLRAIRETAAGGATVSLRVTGAAIPKLAKATRRERDLTGLAAHLTDRELQIFRLAGLAMPTRTIAGKLGVSVKTVETHRENIKNKLDLHSHGELVARAAQWVRENGGT